MKMKKWMSGLLVLALLLSMSLCTVACTEKPEAPVDDDAPAVKTSMFAVKYNGTAIELGKDASPVLKKLGDPTSEPKSVASCGEGMGEQWQYTYSSIVLFTVRNGESETIDAVILRDDVATTVDGVTIGSTESDMTGAYGEPTKQGNKRRYTEGNYTLEFLVDDAGVVTAAELRVEN